MKKKNEGTSITIDKLHSIYYERFEKLNRFFAEHNINYYATGGTLLGAIRHNGFIPWDDDMDLIMTRDNYNRFLEVASELNQSYFTVINYKNKKPIEHALTKICLVGVIRGKSNLVKKCDRHFHIDIFPLDHPFLDTNRQMKLIRKTKRIKQLLYFKTRSLNATKWFKAPFLLLVKFLLLPISTTFLAQKYDQLVSFPNDNEKKNDELLWVSSGVYSYKKELHNNSEFDKAIKHIFGPTYINVPSGFHVFLSNTYGENYMTPFKREDGDFSCLLTDDFVN